MYAFKKQENRNDLAGLLFVQRAIILANGVRGMRRKVHVGLITSYKCRTGCISLAANPMLSTSLTKPHFTSLIHD